MIYTPSTPAMQPQNRLCERVAGQPHACYDAIMIRIVPLFALLLTGLLLATTPAVAAKKPATTATPPPQVAAAPAGLSAPPPATLRQDSFLIEPLGKNVYAAIAKIGGKATSNAMFVIGEQYVVAAGAHMTKEVIQDLRTEIVALTAKPIRYFVLAHHHPGFTHVDFDFPAGQDVIMSWQAWQDMNGEVRKPAFPILFFNEGLRVLLNNGINDTDKYIRCWCGIGNLFSLMKKYPEARLQGHSSLTTMPLIYRSIFA